MTTNQLHIIKYLISFTKNQHSIRLFRFNGSKALEHLSIASSSTSTSGSSSSTSDGQPSRKRRRRSSITHEYIYADAQDISEPNDEREEEEEDVDMMTSNTFSAFFSEAYEVLITAGSELLCKDFCLISAEGRHVSCCFVFCCFVMVVVSMKLT